MILRIVATFIVFSLIAYYFNIDVRAIVDKSGFPKWINGKVEQITETSSTTEQ